MAKEDKQYEFREKEDYIIYLNELIIKTDIYIECQKRYVIELDRYIHSINKDIGVHIDYKVYTEFLMKLQFSQLSLLNLLGDSQKVSMSYFKFRNVVVKNRRSKGNLGFEFRELDSRVDVLLTKMNLQRNWQNHVPESLIIAKHKLVNNHECNFYKNPIIIEDYKYCSLEYFLKLYASHVEFLDEVLVIYDEMKKDYSALIGEDVEILRPKIDTPFNSGFSRVSKMSAKVQGLLKD
ncbi:hypothetical protein COM77_23430 [Bacillus cereus]|uniref:hypothetical protein n=2 Tax=Bacillus cereus TaxID=1396 RepID=UPI000BEC2ABC|nr:hypothetical protein [Bacillus cereus]MDA1935436.1 hypothetical protein [Bacillus cereus]MDA1941341.1 hypothetical protein [Bacillus cereus]PEB33868.1 hypothetical protein COM77_23430 [Bacillus cereus]